MTLESATLPIRVVVVDDHDVVHAGIEAWCGPADPPICVIGGFTSLTDFTAALPTLDGRFDVVVLDLQFADASPDFATLRMLCDRDLRVIVYTQMTADEIILTCLDIGAVTFLDKSEGKRHLIDAVYGAAAATPYVGPRMARALVNDSTLGRVRLSEREREVLVAWFQTENKDLVGKRLFIAPTTVRTHLQRARAKYALVGRPAPTKSALLARAVEDGLLSVADL